MKLIYEKGRRGGRVYTRKWELDDNWEMCARKWGSVYAWQIYRWNTDRRDTTIHSPAFYTKKDALDFYRAHSKKVETAI
jgi:hypothetical protein